MKKKKIDITKLEKTGMAGKTGWGILKWFDNWLSSKLVPLVPSWLQTYHLTYSTILWSALIVLGGWLAGTRDMRWMYFVAVMIAMQYVTDLLDGKIGKERNTGLIQWGYYMDHFLDYVFLCSIVISYALALPGFNFKMLVILALFAGFMVNSFLAFSATNEFKIHYLGFGPTEMRILFIIVNIMLAIFGKTYVALELPYILALAFIGLVIVVYRKQKHIWKLDEKVKGRIIK